MGDVVPFPGMDLQPNEHQGKPVRVEWTDSGLHIDNGWAPIENFLDANTTAMSVETVGLWMGENDDIVAVAQSRDKDNNNWMAAQVILKRCILSVEFL